MSTSRAARGPAAARTLWCPSSPRRRTCSRSSGRLANKYGAAIALPGGALPSALLFQTANHYLYVGGSDGWLYQIDTLAVPVAPAGLCASSCAGKPPGFACTTTAPPCTQTCDGARNCN